MNELIDSKDKKSRKIHICDLCGGEIAKGEQYHWSKGLYDGTFYEWHEHKRCEFICGQIWNYVDPDEGMTRDEFMEAMHNFCQSFICPDCKNWNTEFEDCEMDYCGQDKFCIDKVYEFLQTHELYRAERSMFGDVWKCRAKMESEG